MRVQQRASSRVRGVRGRAPLRKTMWLCRPAPKRSALTSQRGSAGVRSQGRLPTSPEPIFTSTPSEQSPQPRAPSHRQVPTRARPVARRCGRTCARGPLEESCGQAPECSRAPTQAPTQARAQARTHPHQRARTHTPSAALCTRTRTAREPRPTPTWAIARARQGSSRSLPVFAPRAVRPREPRTNFHQHTREPKPQAPSLRAQPSLKGCDMQALLTRGAGAASALLPRRYRVVYAVCGC